jgi:hypothetical protein
MNRSITVSNGSAGGFVTEDDSSAPADQTRVVARKELEDCEDACDGMGEAEIDEMLAMKQAVNERRRSYMGGQ